jgi:NAD(P)-dependent dehydrogenase (short-subunit alcohol dehydrogenase family)
MSVEEWKAVIDVHLNGTFYVSRAAATLLQESEFRPLHQHDIDFRPGRQFGQANYAAAKLGIAALSKSMALDMAKYKVTSNCISPFAWSRMIGTIPADTPDQQARLEKIKRMETAKIARSPSILASDASQDVTGQIFAVRANEIFLMSQSRPLRSVHRAEGWTPETIAEQAIPAMRAQFYALDRSQDVFSWDPI